MTAYLTPVLMYPASVLYELIGIQGRVENTKVRDFTLLMSNRWSHHGDVAANAEIFLSFSRWSQIVLFARELLYIVFIGL